MFKYILIMISCLFLLGCDNEKKYEKMTDEKKIVIGNAQKIYYRIIEIDNHEYIASISTYGFWIIGAHYMNCKYCKK